MTKRRLSDQFREQLNSLGESLATHTRSLEGHFEGQEQLLIERQQALAKDQQQLLLSEKKSGDEAVPCFAPGGFGGEVLEDARLFSFNAAALRLLPGSSLTAARRN